MRIIRHTRDTPKEARGAALAIGNFDGVHLGHRAVIGEARAIAEAEAVPLAVMTFEPHPRAFFDPGAEPFRLTPFRAKAAQLLDLGVDYLVVLRFNKKLSSMPAERFVSDILVDGLGAAHVITGYDFVFGKGRGGSAETLLAAGKQHGFNYTVVTAHGDEVGERYSSTRVRAHLLEGDPRAAAMLLGRPFAIEGRVVKGDQRGRTIGFPTANVRLKDHLRAKRGVYAVRVETDGAAFDGVANLGKRPTVGGTEDLLEVSLFDFSGDLYGQRLRVLLMDFIRAEKKFDGLDALKAQIASDAGSARQLLKKNA